MYFLYVDGSGQTTIKRSKQNNGLYILGGVIVHEKDWKPVEEKLVEVKQELLPELDPGEWELHAFDIWNSKGFFAKEELNVNLTKKQEIFSKIVDFICKSDVTLVNVIIFKDRMRDKYMSPLPMKYSWIFMTERFEHFLNKKPPTTNNGLIFMDSSQKTPESEIKDVIWNLVRNGSPWQNISHVIEDPIFTRSHLRNLIQLADMVAYIVHRHYKGDLRFKGWFKSLECKMYHHNGNTYGFGLKEFPA